jgi:hypothetical protein
MSTKAQFLAHLSSRLEALPFVETTRFEEVPPQAGRGSQLELEVETPSGEYHLTVELRQTALSYALVDRVLSARKELENGGGWILLAPYVSPRIGRYLVEHGGNFFDELGNCHLVLDDRYVAIVEGRRAPSRRASGLGFRAAGYRVIFALLARPDLLQGTVREIAGAAGVGKTTAAMTLQRLRQELVIAPDRWGYRMLQPSELMDRWLVAYQDIVRPSLFVGNFRVQERDPQALERRIEHVLEQQDIPWYWGGGAALHRINGFYRGEATVLHLPEPPINLPRVLRALPAEEGPFTVLRLPGPVGATGLKAGTAHPLLIYSELMTQGDPRGREAAEQFWREYLEGRD